MRNQILKAAYRKLPQHQLNTFVSDVIGRIKGNPAYAAVQDAVPALEARRLEYDAWLQKARVGSPEDTLAKELAKKAMLDQLDRLAMLLELASDGSVAYLVNAGFTPRSATRQSYDGALAPVDALTAMPTARIGEVRCAFTHPVPRAVRLYIAEYSTDRGNTWNPGKFHDQRTFALTGLPNTREAMVRVRAVGRQGEMSPWSQPVMVAVL